MNKLLVIITAFSLGYVLNDLTKTDISLIPEAELSSSQLQRAVKNAIDGNCFVQMSGNTGYIYCA